MRIPDPDPDFLCLSIADPGTRGQKVTGSRIRNTATKLAFFSDTLTLSAFTRQRQSDEAASIFLFTIDEDSVKK
jgi:hypothetical protein